MSDFLYNPLTPILTAFFGLVVGALVGYLARSREIQRLEKMTQHNDCWVKYQVQVNQPQASLSSDRDR